jgi:uncharacterized integral membrane protein
MKSTTNLLAVLLLAVWLVVVAVVSVQNAQPVSLNAFGFQTVAIPFGLLLTFAAVSGMVGTIVLAPIFRPGGARANKPDHRPTAD